MTFRSRAATLAPPTGLRQISVSRFTFGIWGARLCSILNVVVNLSFGVSNAIVGGQLLVAAAGETIPQWAGILTLVGLAWIVAFFGFRLIHSLLRYVWIVSLALIIAMWIQSAKYWPAPADRHTASLEGAEHTGGALTFFSLCFGSGIAWTTMAGDYYVHYPANINPLTVFGLTFAGIAGSLFFCLPVGVLLGAAIFTNEDLLAIYSTGNVGGIMKAILTPARWGNTACILYFLTMGNSASY